MRFHKYHGLGNDYLVIPDTGLDTARACMLAPIICDRNRGIGSDGLLLDRTDESGFAVEIVNPDGSLAEKSGNGLRIFARYLSDRGVEALTSEVGAVVTTAGGDVRCRVIDDGSNVVVEMGQASFESESIPMAGPARSVVNEALSVGGRTFRVCAVTVGNPHCVLLDVDATREDIESIGPLVERHESFPNRTNVQFLKVIDRSTIEIGIWERGAGYTLASGSSSCAAAAASVRMGWCDGSIRVCMPGGELAVEVDDEYRLTMTGPVVHVGEGMLSRECLEQN
jgi:diaminopimelate epimerase